MSRKTSIEVVEKIKSFEELRIKSYRCSANKLTIGYGHTKDVKENQTISVEQAEDFLNEDLKTYENYVDNLEMKYGYFFTQNQFDALVDFAYNVGIGNLKSSTLLKKVNAKNFSGAALEFIKWNKADGKVLPGLTKRRTAEKDLFIK